MHQPRPAIARLLSFQAAPEERIMGVDEIARRAAERLGPELNPNLPAIVETQLQGGKPPEKYEPITIAIGIALASLVVSASKAAWDVHRDLKKNQATAPTPDVMARRLRLEIEIDERVSTEQ